VNWAIAGPWSITVRPEFAWDRDGRWIGAKQSVRAFTSTVEFRQPVGEAQAIVNSNIASTIPEVRRRLFHRAGRTARCAGADAGAAVVRHRSHRDVRWDVATLREAA
jgi:hypothetical protein